MNYLPISCDVLFLKKHPLFIKKERYSSFQSASQLPILTFVTDAHFDMCIIAPKSYKPTIFLLTKQAQSWCTRTIMYIVCIRLYSSLFLCMIGLLNIIKLAWHERPLYMIPSYHSKIWSYFVPMMVTRFNLISFKSGINPLHVIFPHEERGF